MPFLDGTVAGYTDPSALLWLQGDVTVAAGQLFYSVVFGSLRVDDDWWSQSIHPVSGAVSHRLRRRPNGRIRAPSLRYTQPVVAFGLGLVLLHSWFLTMKIGAALTAPKVQQVIDAAKRGQPAASTADWHKNVTRPALDLHELMGQLTTV